MDPVELSQRLGAIGVNGLRSFIARREEGRLLDIAKDIVMATTDKDAGHPGVMDCLQWFGEVMAMVEPSPQLRGYHDNVIDQAVNSAGSILLPMSEKICKSTIGDWYRPDFFTEYENSLQGWADALCTAYAVPSAPVQVTHPADILNIMRQAGYSETNTPDALLETANNGPAKLWINSRVAVCNSVRSYSQLLSTIGHEVCHVRQNHLAPTAPAAESIGKRDLDWLHINNRAASCTAWHGVMTRSQYLSQFAEKDARYVEESVGRLLGLFFSTPLGSIPAKSLMPARPNPFSSRPISGM